MYRTQVLVLSENQNVGSFPVAALVSLSKTLWMGRKAVGPVCCVMHVKEPTIKRRGLPRCFWFGWLQIAAHHLVNPYKVLSYKWVS